MTASPPPPPPPPGSRSPTPGAGRARLRLDQVASPYPVWLGLVVLVIFAAPNLFVLATGGLEAAGDMELSEAALAFTLVITLIVQLLLFGAALLPLLLTRRLDRRLFGPVRGGWRLVGWGVVAGVVTAIVSYTLNALLATVLGVEEPAEQQLLQNAMEGGLPLLLAGVIAVVVAPVTEEMLFRGVLFRSLLSRVGPWAAALLTAALFSLIHIEILFSQPVALTGLFVVGLLLALAYQLTGSLWVPIVGHAVFNTISIGLALLFERLVPEEMFTVAAILVDLA